MLQPQILSHPQRHTGIHPQSRIRARSKFGIFVACNGNVHIVSMSFAYDGSDRGKASKKRKQTNSGAEQSSPKRVKHVQLNKINASITSIEGHESMGTIKILAMSENGSPALWFASFPISIWADEIR